MKRPTASIAMTLMALGALLVAGYAAALAQGDAPGLSRKARLGKAMFFDESLSGSGQMSCATCHSPQHAFGPPDALAARPGGRELTTPGTRAVPSLMYKKFTPAFGFDEEGTASGGFTLDGRSDTLGLQAAIPLLAAHEMANDSPGEVVEKILKAPYAAEFRSLFGDEKLADTPAAFAFAGEALDAFQREAAEFAPFSSKFDAYLKGTAKLSEQELRGLALFKDPQKGNCAACHTIDPLPDGTPPLFTDFTYDNVGVPRNRDIAANADPAYYDLGLCGPDRKDLAARKELCGAFKVPTLRNVAMRQVFFHNGVFHDLAESVRFYAERDTHPEKWYKDGIAYNDVPEALRGSVNRDEAPYDRKKGEQPRLNESEVQDIVAYLKTLNDGWKPEAQ